AADGAVEIDRPVPADRQEVAAVVDRAEAEGSVRVIGDQGGSGRQGDGRREPVGAGHPGVDDDAPGAEAEAVAGYGVVDGAGPGEVDGVDEQVTEVVVQVGPRRRGGGGEEQVGAGVGGGRAAGPVGGVGPEVADGADPGVVGGDHAAL